MSRIHRLPPDLANQIAAGEVVERPASVVKELIENAIDAGARRIAVTAEFGGKKLIRVEDDGEGMDPEDARLSVERHATSKIRRADDLERIGTLGFRGEALPSIASVSRFVLRTRARGASTGTELRVNAGTVAAVNEAGMPEGTSIEVADLFYNLPARRKFLKSDAAEAAQLSRLVTQLALCYPSIGFALTSSGRKVLQCPPVSSLRDRLYQIYGDRPDLIEVAREGSGMRVTGYIAALADAGAQGGPTRGPQHIFINGRIVKDRTIAHAIIDAYSVASIRERSPEVHLFIEMPLDALDVNVHPTKAEVRFRDQSYVHQMIRRTLGDALGRGPAPELTLQPPPVHVELPSTLPLPASYGTTFPSRWVGSGEGGGRGGDHAAHTAGGALDAGSGAGVQLPDAIADIDAAFQRMDAADGAGRPAGAPVTIRPLMPLGQFRDTFILAVDDEGVAIIDQHVAHERVLFERITERLSSGRLESQRLLEPTLVQLPPGSRQALLAHAAELERLGFEIEEFGGDVVRVSAYPAILSREDCDAAIRALADDLEGLGGADRRGGSPAPPPKVDEAIKRIAATMACHAAVKANYPLTPEKMRHILDELRRTAYSTICPHGRPVMLRLTRREIEKNFQRI